MVDLRGASSNLLDELFSELEDWEAVLSALPDHPKSNDPEDL
jgi:hypothetical protein